MSTMAMLLFRMIVATALTHVLKLIWISDTWLPLSKIWKMYSLNRQLLVTRGLHDGCYISLVHQMWSGCLTLPMIVRLHHLGCDMTSCLRRWWCCRIFRSYTRSKLLCVLCDVQHHVRISLRLVEHKILRLTVELKLLDRYRLVVWGGFSTYFDCCFLHLFELRI